ncbi:TAP-like protein-domain-containing protein [Auriculariales sp. MPI-PUGE-AT-0066]|nr:TAP-like protein-domain-containing protein [Auriculariales sp. MPI-PUGE-AT-0066]
MTMEKSHAHENSVDFPSREKRSSRVLALLVVAGILTFLATTRNGNIVKLPWGLSTAVKGPVDWQPCGGSIQCGRLDVPLDYHDRSKGTVSLALARVPATSPTQTRAGILFLNPGGPGGSGVNLIYRKGETLHQLLDGRYDILSWDPRGVNGSDPLRCFASDTAQALFSHHSALERINAGNLSDPSERVYFARKCANGMPGSGWLASSARRMLVGTVLAGPQAPINYWGFSYGTALGSYWVNMFPHRVGRAIIDGVLVCVLTDILISGMTLVQDPEDWAHSQYSDWAAHSLIDIMKAFRNFVSACANAGPERCALAKDGSTPESVEATIDGLLAHLSLRPLPVFNTTFPELVTSAHIKQLLFTAMYAPATWPGVASLLADVLSGDGSRLLASLPVVELNSTKAASTLFAFNQVVCSDAPELSPKAASTAVEKLQAEVIRLYEEDGNKYFAASMMSACHAWPVRPARRFEGPFNNTLRNPILVIGNTADPVTPLRNAMRVNKLLGNSSRLIIQDSTGHCSVSTASLCTTNAIRAYLLNGTLPENGLFCAPSELPFPEASNREVATLLTPKERTPDNIRLLRLATDLREDWHGRSSVF